MAIYHCSIQNVSRAKGSSSCATLAYISGEKVYDERQQETFSYSREERVLEVGTILPESAPAEYADPKTLFNAIEQHETSDKARTAKKIEVALPKELDRATQKQIVEDFVRNNLTKEGYCVTYALHDGNEKKNGNDHAHILVANRQIVKGEWGCKRKMAYALDENGERIPALEYQKNEKGKFIRDENGEKIPVLDDNGKPIQKKDGKGTPQWVRVNVEQNPLDTKDFLFHLRKEWAVECNKYLEPEHQIDHRSNAARGIEDTPTIHEGYAARAMEARGEVSERCQINRDIKRENEQRREIRAEIAAAIEQDKALEKKEREHDERLAKLLGRRTNFDGANAGRDRSPAGEGATHRTVDSNDTTAREQAGRADRLRKVLERRERDAAEVRREREEAERRQREADEAKRRAREAAEAKRQRNSRSYSSEQGFSR